MQKVGLSVCPLFEHLDLRDYKSLTQQIVMYVHLYLAFIKFVLEFATHPKGPEYWKANCKSIYKSNGSDMIFGTHDKLYNTSLS